MRWLLLGTLGLTAAVAAQPAAAVFEVASIKPHKEDYAGNGGMSAQHGRLNVSNMSLKNLITSAYDLRDFQVIGGPSWIDSATYDVSAKAENDASFKELWLMVRPLLAERFKLAVHTEKKELPVYELVVGKRGSKLPSAKEDGQRASLTARSLTADKMSMPVFSQILASLVRRPVVDKTGIQGDFSVKLEWVPGEANPDGPSIFSVIEDQLGLKLESRKGPVDILVIDHIERPSEN